MDDAYEVFRHYPEMIRISMSPAIWEGLITIRRSNISDYDVKLKMKFIVPYYPRLDKAEIFFGKNIAILNNLDIKKDIDNLIENSENVVEFFNQLKTMIEEKVFQHVNMDFIYNPVKGKSRDKLLKELDQVLKENSEVQFLSTKDLSLIKVLMDDVSIMIQPFINSNGENSWKITSSELPQAIDHKTLEKKLCTLKEIRNWFQKQVRMFTDFWNELNRLDRYCWITDPINPRPYHAYRRITISENLSVMVTLNPLSATELPSIKFLGRTNEVEKYEEIVGERLVNWDQNCSVYENLLDLLNLEEFPKPPMFEESIPKEGLVDKEECCICFSMELDDGVVPDIICDNKQCQRYFHSICLFTWLQESGTAKVIFNKIGGACPNCGNEIICPVQSQK